MTQVCLGTLRSGALTKEANRANQLYGAGAHTAHCHAVHLPLGALLILCTVCVPLRRLPHLPLPHLPHRYDVFHTFHAACFFFMQREWKRRGLSIVDFGYLKKEIEALAHRKPGKLLRALREYDASNGLPAAGGGKKGKEELVTFD